MVPPRVPCCILLLSLLAAGAVARQETLGLHQRRLRVLVTPNAPPKTVEYNSSDPLESNYVPLDSPLVAPAPGCQPEQVIVTQWSATDVLISWATCGGVITPNASTAPGRINAALIPSVSLVPAAKAAAGPQPKAVQAKGVTTSYVYDYSNNKGNCYTSPYLHHVLVKGLAPGQTYSYSLSVAAAPGLAARAGYPAAGRVTLGGLQLTVPPAKFPLRIGVIADPAQTTSTVAVLRGLVATQPQQAWIIGDFAYADKVLLEDKPADALKGDITYQPLWDTWQRLFSKSLLSAVPFQHTSGNHESPYEYTFSTAKLAAQKAAEAANATAAWAAVPLPGLAPSNPYNNASTTVFRLAKEFQMAYNARYPGPSTPARKKGGPTSFQGTSFQDPLPNQYWSVDQPGMARTFWITSYILGDTFSKDSPQYRWLAAELAATDRAIFPWLIVNFHAPWYTSFSDHYQENEAMRQAYEPLLYRSGVDLVYNGHQHTYERSKPVYNWTLDDCGPMHVTIGNGGIELVPETVDKNPEASLKCSGAPGKFYQPQPGSTYFTQNWVPTAIGANPAPNGGVLCPSTQPPWSAYRQCAYGYGTLTLLNATTATWAAYMVEPGASDRVVDAVTITRSSGSAACLAKRARVAS